MEDIVAEVRPPAMEDTVGRGRGTSIQDSLAEVEERLQQKGAPVPATEAVQRTDTLEEAIAEPADRVRRTAAAAESLPHGNFPHGPTGIDLSPATLLSGLQNSICSAETR